MQKLEKNKIKHFSYVLRKEKFKHENIKPKLLKKNC